MATSMVHQIKGTMTSLKGVVYSKTLAIYFLVVLEFDLCTWVLFVPGYMYGRFLIWHTVAAKMYTMLG